MRESRSRPVPANEDCCMIEVQVTPRSSRVAIEHLDALRFKIKLTSAPVDGAANSQLLEVISKRLSLPRRCIEIVSGETGRRKRIRLKGVTAEYVQQHLAS